MRQHIRSHSSVGLERLPAKEEVAGSSPAGCTIKNQKLIRKNGFLFFNCFEAGRESERFMRNAQRHFESEERRVRRRALEPCWLHHRYLKSPEILLRIFLYNYFQERKLSGISHLCILYLSFLCQNSSTMFAISDKSISL